MDVARSMWPCGSRDGKRTIPCDACLHLPVPKCIFVDIALNMVCAFSNAIWCCATPRNAFAIVRAHACALSALRVFIPHLRCLFFFRVLICKHGCSQRVGICLKTAVRRNESNNPRQLEDHTRCFRWFGFSSGATVGQLATFSANSNPVMWLGLLKQPHGRGKG